MAGGKRALLDDEDDADTKDSEHPLELGFNEKYARRFAHNKKREDLHRLQELQKKGLAGKVSDDDGESSSSSEDEDDDGLLPVRVEEKIFETLTKIKNRDPTIYSAETKFFDDDGDDTDEAEVDEAKRTKTQKPMYLKDLTAKQLLQGGEGDEDDETRPVKKPPTSYLSEQDELKRAFLQGVREAEGEDEENAEDNLLRVKKRTKEELEKDAQEAEQAVEEAERRAKDKSIARRLEEYFGKDDGLDDNEKFLKDYLLNKGWIDPDQKQPSYPTHQAEFEEDISEDEEALDKQDEFEKSYNFRFQEGGAGTQYVQGHSRVVESSVRKKSETRKRQREKKKERESEVARARREELKRLKNVKKKEVEEKLSAIRAIAGDREGAVLGAVDLDEDFDPDEHDRKMREAFGEDYYDAEDPDFAEGEEDLDQFESVGLGEDFEDAPEKEGSSAGFVAVTANLEKKKKKKKGGVPADEKRLIRNHLEEYYKLDHEDVVGDLPTRFKYKTVKPSKYGLRTKDILGLEDRELNQYVSVKKLAPYRSEEWEPRQRPPRLSSKGRNKKKLAS